MRFIIFAFAILTLTSCASAPATREVRVIQDWTPCARPVRPYFWQWDVTIPLCADYNLEATVNNWINAQRYAGSLEACIDCYERQMQPEGME